MKTLRLEKPSNPNFTPVVGRGSTFRLRANQRPESPKSWIATGVTAVGALVVVGIAVVSLT